MIWSVPRLGSLSGLHHRRDHDKSGDHYCTEDVHVGQEAKDLTYLIGVDHKAMYMTWVRRYKKRDEDVIPTSSIDIWSIKGKIIKGSGIKEEENHGGSLTVVEINSLYVEASLPNPILGTSGTSTIVPDDTPSSLLLHCLQSQLVLLFPELHSLRLYYSWRASLTILSIIMLQDLSPPLKEWFKLLWMMF